MRQCPLKYKECPLKRPLSGRVVRSFEIQVAKATNGQKNGSAEESSIRMCFINFIIAVVRQQFVLGSIARFFCTGTRSKPINV